MFYRLLTVEATEYRQINPDATGDSLVTSYSGNFDAVTRNPTASQFAFAYSADPLALDPVWQIYKNSTVSITGATLLSSTQFRFVGSIQFTPDGSLVVFTGSVAEGEFGVYRVSSGGTGQLRLDDGEEADVDGSGTKIVYTKLDGASGKGEIWTMNLDGSSQTRLTSNTHEDWFPQWSKDGTKICFYTVRVG